MAISEYGVVRVVQLFHPLEDYDGWRINRRPPQIGDLGTVVDTLHTKGLPDKYVVESTDTEGITIWLGDFGAEELEQIDDSGYVLQTSTGKPG